MYRHCIGASMNTCKNLPGFKNNYPVQQKCCSHGGQMSEVPITVCTAEAEVSF